MNGQNDRKTVFQFKQFHIRQEKSPMKVGTDGVLLGAWADGRDAVRALDIGTGTGVIALMLGQRFPDLEVDAVEIYEAAYEEALANARAVPWSDRIRIVKASVQEFARNAGAEYDLIVSNPPFFSGGTFSDQHDRTAVRHTIKLPHGDLLAAVRRLLSREGRFCLILPLIEGLRFVELAKSYGLYCTHRVEVRPKADKPVERLLLRFEWNAKPEKQETLVIQKEGRNEWTEGYIELTRDFYLKMP